MHAPQRLVGNEPLQRLHAQRELSRRQRTLAANTTRPQAVEVLGQGVLGAIDQAQVLSAAALQGWLHQATFRVARDEVNGLHHHALATSRGELLPCRAARLVRGPTAWHSARRWRRRPPPRTAAATAPAPWPTRAAIRRR